MRVTQGLLFQQALEGIQRHTEAIALQQKQISSGKKFDRVSEDPQSGAASLRFHGREGILERFQRILAEGQDRLDAGAAALQDLSGILAQAKEAAVQAGSPALTPTDRAALADKLDALLGQVLEIANRRDGFGALFAGTETDAPYVLEGGQVKYQGNDGVRTVTAGDSFSLETNIPGSAIFAAQARTLTLFFGGSTGVKAGTGTDSGLDRGSLLVTHGATTLGDGALAGGDSVSGVKLGTGTAQDTVIGNVGTHVLHVDAVNGTISLNGGSAVSFTGTETDLVVADGTGALVHVDVTALTAGFVGNVSIAATGSLSTDGGATQTAIGFNANQTLVNSKDGSTTNVDTTGIRVAGSEVIDYAGTTDLFQSIQGLRDDLRNYSTLPPSVRDASIAARARELSRNLESSLQSLSVLGSRSKSASESASRFQGMRDELAARLSDVEDTDYAEAVVAYNKSQIALEIAQAAGSRLLNTNYLAFLQ